MNAVECEKSLRKELIGEVSDDTFRKNYLIEAGAGAGKTFILSNRIVNQILHDQASPDELVAITFTEKATQEMISRMDQEISARLEAEIRTHGEVAETVRKIRDLSDGIDQMQISTIHSFCHTLLMTMPFHSELGPEFEVTEDAQTLAAGFIEQKLRENPELFDRLEARTGLSRELFLCNFRSVCESRAELQYDELTEERYGLALGEMADHAHQIWDVLRERADWTAAREAEESKARVVTDMLPQIHEVIRLMNGTEEVFTETVLSVCNPCLSAQPITLEAVARVLKARDESGKKITLKANKSLVEGHWRAITEKWQSVIHSCVMEELAALIPEYREYKKSLKVATQQDLLYCARDLLKNSSEARHYFHQRYRCIYVDEMQDTDPVQAQILFYLATDEEHFDPDDWRNCRPVPGSLFLVGDPKQAIYRFRGADIGVYKTLMDLFRGGIGEVVSLGFNYRSSAEITAFSDAVFAGRMVSGPYQAEYSRMTAVHGSSERSVIRAYPSTKESDPQRVAAFIHQMVANQVHLGLADNEHEASYRDFMILTSRNSRTEAYVQALSDYGIPCSMSGAKKYAEIPLIRRLTLVLKYLADSVDELKLASVLVNCYRIPFPVLRAYRQRTGRLNADHHRVRSALVNEDQAWEFEMLFSALEELEQLRDLAERLSSRGLADWIARKSRAVWGSDRAESCSKEYAMLLQFVRELCAGSVLSIPSLASGAEDLMEGAADRELLLDGDENCVQILNLHKAKGLESEVVILACDSEFPKKAVKHAVFDGNREYLHCCISYKSSYGTDVILGKPDTWDTEAGAEELEFLEKQVDRLLYVAATRAKTCLLIGDTSRSTWQSIVKAGQDAGEKAREGVPAFRGFERFTLNPDNDAEQKETPWTEPFRALLEGCSLSDRPGRGEAAPAMIDSNAIEHALAERVGALSGRMTAGVSPSMVEKGRKVPDAVSENESVPEPEVPSYVTVADLEGDAHGPFWGTVIHRVMELCVKKNVFDAPGRKKFAERAFRETMQSEGLSSESRKLLDPLGRYRDDEELICGVVEQAVNLTAFIEDPGHPLTALLKDGRPYAELPFQFREEAPDARIRELCAAIIQPEDERCVEIHGIIDLAVQSGSEWIIIDYKTDAFQVGETQEQFEARLREQYSPQIMLYREILQRMSLGTVKDMYLCSIALQGAMICLNEVNG